MNKPLMILAILALTHSHSALATDAAARDIMVKNEAARNLAQMEAQAKLTTGAKGQAEKIKDFTIQRKLSDDRVHNKTFTRFHAPAEVRNEGILIIENDGGKNDVLLYLPNFKKIRRVETQQQSGSFMGSAFSYSDIATPHVSDYEYKKLREEACPTADSKTVKCAVIESIPANEDVKDRTGYSKSIVWVRLDNFMLVKAEYTGIDGALFKKLEAGQIHKVDAAKNKWHADYLQIENVKTGELTKLQFSGVKVTDDIPNSVFTQQNLQKVN